MNKNIAIMSGYIRYRPIKKSYNININSRILAKHLKSLRAPLKIIVNREKYQFHINFDSKGNSPQIRDKEITISISSKRLLTKAEISKLRNENNKNCLPIKIIVGLDKLNLNRFYFYPDKDSANLAKELEKLNLNIPNRIMTPKAYKSDLEFNYKNKKIIIEITRRVVSKKLYSSNFKHQHNGGNIRAHIFDIYRRCVNDKLKNKNKTMGFVILQKEWKEITHIKEIINELKQVNCHILFTNFQNKNWAKNISNDI